MTEEVTYSVMLTGETKDGYDRGDIHEAFAGLFKVDLEKARTIIGQKCVIKKGLDQATADRYKDRLESIGIVASLKKHELPKPSTPADALSLAPMDAHESPRPEAPADALSLAPMEAKGPDAPAVESSSNPPGQANDTAITCPKCRLEQPRAEQCAGCGIYFNKLPGFSVHGNPEEGERQASGGQEDLTEDTYPSLPADRGFTLKTLLVGAVVALLGALLWKFIAVTFEYEFGIIAWLIGGAIGFSAAVAGSSGNNGGIACGALALVAILGGKYMAMSSFQDQWADMMTDEMQGEPFRAAYEEELGISGLYVSSVTDEDSLRQFMVDYGYSQSTDTTGVTDIEIEQFEKYSKTRLEKLAAGSMSFEAWLESQQLAMGDISTLALLQESIGILDILFLLLGVGTAFRLGRGEQV